MSRKACVLYWNDTLMMMMVLWQRLTIKTMEDVTGTEMQLACFSGSQQLIIRGPTISSWQNKLTFNLHKVSTGLHSLRILFVTYFKQLVLHGKVVLLDGLD